LIKILLFVLHVALALLVVVASISAFVEDTTLNNWVVIVSVGSVSIVFYLVTMYSLVNLYDKWSGNE
jgi:hypothetical protein